MDETQQMLFDLKTDWVEAEVPDLRSEYREGKKEYPDMDDEDGDDWSKHWKDIKKVDESLSWHYPTPHEQLCDKLDQIIVLLTQINQKQS